MSSPPWPPVAELLRELLDRITAELPGALGAAISVRDDGGSLNPLATAGVAARFVPAQLEKFGGPVPHAAATGRPTVSSAVFADERWPDLTLGAVTDAVPELRAQWQRVRGAAALPCDWADNGRFVLSATLDRPATEATVGVLARYEKLVAMTLVVGEAATAYKADHMVGLLQSRAAIEEAKGIVVAIRRCGPDEAWATLRRASQRRASQEFNVKLRELAVALIEYVGRAPAPQPDGGEVITPRPEARQAAENLWHAFTAVS
ncbi:ANTAR domain-containing protein [Amycolatopsis acidiphila]|uniref:ANTAR domain-containing protein n=1 Tax=Amycolatopsis acidiphila TaxID=715473 RepID=A0A558ADG6_9PSEU|nr:ANTAR domain-containing protein [Amycolatopsis acidiphila]TVT22253.1 ANTAR domain-containing protein [Amycolatopsis acidiphila]UIJ58037.1 ANTAR domain-containing protein [Amycolatopsis acidiphila]GHG70475.1 ANTAR domain-containing protein [Amycolatopsis acidiphila]